MKGIFSSPLTTMRAAIISRSRWRVATSALRLRRWLVLLLTSSSTVIISRAAAVQVIQSLLSSPAQLITAAQLAKRLHHDNNDPSSSLLVVIEIVSPDDAKSLSGYSRLLASRLSVANQYGQATTSRWHDVAPSVDSTIGTIGTTTRNPQGYTHWCFVPFLFKGIVTIIQG